MEYILDLRAARTGNTKYRTQLWMPSCPCWTSSDLARVLSHTVSMLVVCRFNPEKFWCKTEVSFRLCLTFGRKGRIDIQKEGPYSKPY